MFLLKAFLCDPKAARVKTRTGKMEDGAGAGFLPRPSLWCSVTFLDLGSRSAPWDGGPWSACSPGVSWNPGGSHALQSLLPAQRVGCQGRICQNEVKAPSVWNMPPNPSFLPASAVLRGAVGPEELVSGKRVELLVPIWARRRPEPGGHTGENTSTWLCTWTGEPEARPIPW